MTGVQRGPEPRAPRDRPPVGAAVGLTVDGEQPRWNDIEDLIRVLGFRKDVAGVTDGKLMGQAEEALKAFAAREAKVRAHIDERVREVHRQRNSTGLDFDGGMDEKHWRRAGRMEARRQLAVALQLSVPFEPGDHAAPLQRVPDLSALEVGQQLVLEYDGRHRQVIVTQVEGDTVTAQDHPSTTP